MTLSSLIVFVSFLLFLTEVDSRPVEEGTYDSVNSRLPRRTKRFPTISANLRNLPKGKKTRLPSPQYLLKDVYIFKDLFEEKQSSDDSHTGRDTALNLNTLQGKLRLKLHQFDEAQTLSSPRCGVTEQNMRKGRETLRDFANRLRVTTTRRVRRFVTQGSKWSHSKIRWTIKSGDFSSKMSEASVKSVLTNAFRTWAEVIPLVFRWEPIATRADITIRFVTGYHGDSKSFDGPGNELAHAFYPQYGGDIHFDDDEPWTPSTSDATHKSLLKVATHEIGHSLGLSHSTQAGSIMNPVYALVGTSLGDDDIKGVQSLYGLCDPIKIDAIESYMHNGQTYIFKGSSYWRYDDLNKRAAPGYPTPITAWLGVPNDIDEAFLWGHNWQYYFFKGPDYYRYNGVTDSVDPGYPRLISQGWPGLPASGIDAGFTFSNQVSYFFKGDLCYQFDNTLGRVATGWPKLIRDVWSGVPNDLDSVFRWYNDGETYFFKGQNYWKWDSSTYRARGPFTIMHGWQNLCEV